MRARSVVLSGASVSTGDLVGGAASGPQSSRQKGHVTLSLTGSSTGHLRTLGTAKAARQVGTREVP
eukprot:247361-Rhodomonas_salina.3